MVSILHCLLGTGKTLMARQIGKMLNCREPKIISGPGECWGRQCMWRVAWFCQTIITVVNRNCFLFISQRCSTSLLANLKLILGKLWFTKHFTHTGWSLLKLLQLFCWNIFMSVRRFCDWIVSNEVTLYVVRGEMRLSLTPQWVNDCSF